MERVGVSMLESSLFINLFTDNIVGFYQMIRPFYAKTGPTSGVCFLLAGFLLQVCWETFSTKNLLLEIFYEKFSTTSFRHSFVFCGSFSASRISV